MPVPFTVPTSRDNKMPDRIRTFCQRGQMRLKRALTKARSLSIPPVDATGPSSLPLRSPSRLVSQTSVLSLGSLTAWNRLSMVSGHENDSDLEVEYRLHQPASCASTLRTSKSYDGCDRISLQDRILDVQNMLPEALEYQSASESYDGIHRTTTIPMPASKAFKVEPWSDFMDRIFHHERDPRLDERDPYHVELQGSTVAPDQEHVAIDGPLKHTEDEWQALEALVLQSKSADTGLLGTPARPRKATIARIVSREDIKLVNVSTSLMTPSHRAESPGLSSCHSEQPPLPAGQHSGQIPVERSARSQRKVCGLLGIERDLELYFSFKSNIVEAASCEDDVGIPGRRTMAETKWHEGDARLKSQGPERNATIAPHNPSSFLPDVLVPASKHNRRWSAPFNRMTTDRPLPVMTKDTQVTLTTRRNLRPLSTNCSGNIPAVKIRQARSETSSWLSEAPKPSAGTSCQPSEITATDKPPSQVRRPLSQRAQYIPLVPVEEVARRVALYEPTPIGQRTSATTSRLTSDMGLFPAPPHGADSPRPSPHIPKIVISSPPPRTQARPAAGPFRSHSTTVMLASFPVPPTATTCPSPAIPHINGADREDTSAYSTVQDHTITVKPVKSLPLPTGSAILRRASKWRHEVESLTRRGGERARDTTVEVRRERMLRELGGRALKSHPPFVSDRNFTSVAAYRKS